MKKIIILFAIIALVFTYSTVYSAQQTVIGTINASGNPTFSVNTSTLMQAFEDELNDGSDITDVQIKQDDNSDWFLVGFGTNGSKKLSAYLKLYKNSNNELTIALIPDNANLTICSTINCFDARQKACCDWKVCVCDGCGGQCYKSHNVIDNGIGYLGNFY